MTSELPLLQHLHDTGRATQAQRQRRRRLLDEQRAHAASIDEAERRRRCATRTPVPGVEGVHVVEQRLSPHESVHVVRVTDHRRQESWCLVRVTSFESAVRGHLVARHETEEAARAAMERAS